MHPLTRRMATIVVSASLLTAGLASTGAAQDPSDSPAAPQTCGVLTADEVSTALGMTMTVASGGTTECEFDADPSSGSYVSLFSTLQSGDLETMRTLLCSGFASPAPTISPTCAIDVQVAGMPAVYLPDALGTMLYVQTSADDMLVLQMVGDAAAGVDKQAALTGLGELAVPRLAGLPQPTAEPTFAQPSFTADADLEALFPTDIGGTPMVVESLMGPDLAAQSDVPDEFLAALAAAGKTIEDVSIAIGYMTDPSATTSTTITAFKVKGVDMAGLKATLLPIIYQDQTISAETPQQIGGKDVTSVTVGEQAAYLYPKDDVLWVVSASDPALTEIIQKLP